MQRKLRAGAFSIVLNASKKKQLQNHKIFKNPTIGIALQICVMGKF